MKTPLVDPPLTGNEKEVVLGYIAFQQDVFLRKLQASDGSWLAEDSLSRALPPSSMTLKGMAAHLWFVEDYWRDYILLGKPEMEPWASTDWNLDPDADWHSTLPIEIIIKELKLSTNKTRKLLQGTDWDDVSKRANGEGNHFSYRWVALHLIEEWSRHLGHADLLRENIDGETGD